MIIDDLSILARVRDWLFIIDYLLMIIDDIGDVRFIID
jgi:hypothetical protein